MQHLIQLAFGAFGTLLFVALAHRKIGNYPKALLKSKNSRLELLEVFIIWGLMFASVTYLVLASYLFKIFYPFVEIGGFWFSMHFFLMLIVPFSIEVLIHHRSMSELGFSLPINWLPASALIAFGFFFGFFAFLFERPNPASPRYLLMGLLTPAFTEEWVYRSVIQTKLERVLDQNGAWLLAGLLFGLIHVPTNFFGPLWVASGGEIIAALVRLFGQCTFGWLWGILFMKCRSLFPTVIAHYLSDFLPGILAHV